MMGLLSGLDPIAPFPIPIPDLPEFGEIDLPDIAPLNFPSYIIFFLEALNLSTHAFDSIEGVEYEHGFSPYVLPEDWAQESAVF